jgi:hypothetical protein
VVALLPVIKYVATHEQTNNYSESVRNTVIENATGNTSAAEASAASRASSSRSSSSSAASVAGGSGTATPPTPNDPNNRKNNKHKNDKKQNDLQRLSENRLKQILKNKGREIHEFKNEHVGNDGAEFNAYYSKSTGEIILVQNYTNIPVPTGVTIY